MRTWHIFSIYFCCILLYSCAQDPVVDEDLHGSEQFNRTIRFEVKHVYSISPLLDSAVQDVLIEIYDNAFDFINFGYPAATRTTDSAGYAEINGLNADYYYIRATHLSFPTETDSVSTPSGSISFVEMYM